MDKSRKLRMILPAIIAILPTVLLWSCSATEIVDSPDPTTKENTISLHITQPGQAATRASTDHKLRFVAKLVKGFYDTSHTAGNDPVLIERQEMLASDGNATITFFVEEGDYTILLFADYIPTGAVPDNNGCYPDKYYDTSLTSTPYMINMKEFDINNDNLDCFAGTVTITKTASKIEENVKLKRMVGKVRFVSTTPLPENAGGTEISFPKLSYYSEIDIHGGDNSVAMPRTVSNLPAASPLNSTYADGEQELFYYLTPANTNFKDLQNLGEIKFSINSQENPGIDREISIAGGTIPARRNAITTVKGAFLSPATPDKGPITLHLSSDNTWGTETTHIPD